MGLRSSFVRRTPFGKSLIAKVETLTAERNRLREQLARCEAESARALARSIVGPETGERPFCEEDVVKLGALARRGFAPRCVFDAGASNGLWSRLLARTFPAAKFHLFEPLADIEETYAGLLAKNLAECPQLELHKTALGARTGTVSFQRGADPTGSTVLDARAAGAFTTIEVPITTIDTLIAEKKLPVPGLLKMDVQGSELEILRGAEKNLPQIELLLIETWLTRGYGKETPLYHELVHWLLPRGFHLIDFTGEFRGENDELFAQDMIFVNESSELRRGYHF